MFTTNVMGPFLFTEQLIERLQRSDAIVVQVIAPFHKDIDWMDLESLRNHKTGQAFNRTKTCNWAVADRTLASRWPSGFVGLFWKMLTLLMAKPLSVAGEAVANLVLSDHDRQAMNGALFKLEQRKANPDKAMTDVEFGKGSGMNWRAERSWKSVAAHRNWWSLRSA